MDETFDAAVFVSKVRAGVFNGALHEELAKLSREDLEQVAAILAEQAGSQKPKRPE